MRYLKFLPCLLFLVLPACQSFNSLVQEPVVSFNSVVIDKISLEGVGLIARVDVENPNGFSIPLPKIDWEIFINSNSFLKGALKKDQSLKSRGKVTVDIPLSVTYSGLYNSFASLIETKEAAYNVALGISFPIPIIESKVYKLDFSGVIPLPQLPKLNPGSVKVSKIDFSGIELAYELTVENPNAFSVPVPKVNMNYDVNGVPLLKSSIAGPGLIAAGATAPLLFSIGVSYADVFKAVSSLRTDGEAKTNLSLGLNPEDSGFSIPAFNGNSRSLDIPGVLPILQKPEISFNGIAKKSLGTTMEFIVSWVLDNKNDFEFDVTGFNYDFSVNGNRWAQGRMDKLPKIKAGGKTIIPLTVSVSALSIVKELVDVINRGIQVNYSCTGNMELLGSIPGLDKIELPLNFQGSARIQ